jgi:hypothetical protein
VAPVSADPTVPDWCAYFDADEYDLFCAALDAACGCYGAEGLDFDDGWVELYAGDGMPDECGYSLHRLAARCRDSAPDEWESLCFRHISEWVEGCLHREWLDRTPFADVEPLLQVWLTAERPVQYEGGRPDDPDEPFSVPLAEGLYLSLLAEVPDLDEASGMVVLVPSSATRAWKQSAEDLLESARRQLRLLPPPIWTVRTIRFSNHLGPTEVDLYYASAAPGVATPVSAWALLLSEVAPVPLPRGAYIVVPERNTLILTPNEVREVPTDRWWALFCKTHEAYGHADALAQVSRQNFGYVPGKGLRAAPWPQRWNPATCAPQA